MRVYQKSRLFKELFNLAPAWALGIADENACVSLLAQLLGRLGEKDSGPELIDSAVALARWSWEFYPLNPDLLPLLCLLADSGVELGPGGPALKALSGKAARLHSSWQSGLAALLAGDEGPLQTLWADLADLPALAGRLRAEAAILSRQENPLSRLARVDAALFGAWKTWQLAKAEYSGGDRGAAIRRLAGLRALYPWQTNLNLVLHELIHPVPELPPEAAPPAVLLYSWNKCAELRTTLDSLRRSGIGAAPVFVLDNGSGDGTAEMLRSRQESWGTPFTVIGLPVNVGAPAARNWLLAIPEVRAQAYAAFLDDDVVLPPGWLSALHRTALAQPKAGTVGCLVTDHLPPYTIQAGDYHLLSAGEGQTSFLDLEEHIFPYSPPQGRTDAFFFRYTRPCASVTGCCHLLSMRAVEELGAFDVRFSPSQFDDLERDLRLNSRGWQVYFHGGLSVRHMQHSSLRQALSIRQQAQIMGNRLKLEFLYSAKEAAGLQAQNRAQLEDDLLRKSAALDKIQAELLEMKP